MVDLQPGEAVLGVTLTTSVPRDHKFALAAIPAGAAVVKYGHHTRPLQAQPPGTKEMATGKSPSGKPV